MKPKALHKEAMDYSFQAKQALKVSNYSLAHELYSVAAEMESKAAEFYFEKPDLEPTRSILIRSAAYLNIKAGLIEEAQRFIFFGLLHLKDEFIRKQLRDALEISVSFNGLNPFTASKEYNYLNSLRQRSEHYVLEPADGVHGTAVTLEMVKDFTFDFLKSLKAYALTSYRNVLGISDEDDTSLEFDQIVDPIITEVSFGSFRFSLANDFVPRMGESPEVINIKSNLITNYHNEIFTNPLSDQDIEKIKKTYSENDINQIFRPLSKIKSAKSTYRVGYYDFEDFSKKFLKRIRNDQRKKLLSIRQIRPEEIGELQSSIIHTRNLQSGRTSKKTILSEQLKFLEFDIRTNVIEVKDKPPLILNEEIIITINFDSSKGFEFSFPDLSVKYIDIEYQRGLNSFYEKLYNRIIFLAQKELEKEEDLKDWSIINELLNDPDSLRT